MTSERQNCIRHTKFIIYPSKLLKFKKLMINFFKFICAYYRTMCLPMCAKTVKGSEYFVKQRYHTWSRSMWFNNDKRSKRVCKRSTGLDCKLAANTVLYTLTLKFENSRVSNYQTIYTSCTFNFKQRKVIWHQINPEFISYVIIWKIISLRL